MSQCNNLSPTISASSYRTQNDYFDALNTLLKKNLHNKKIGPYTIEIQDKTIPHIASTNNGNSNSQRVFDSNRAEKVPWIITILTSSNCGSCKDYYVWEKVNNGKNRLCIMCLKERFLVVLTLNKKTNRAYLVTAYPALYKHAIYDYLNEYYEYKKNGDAI